MLSKNHELVGKEVYIIRKEKAGARLSTDVTFELKGYHCYANEMTARKALADYVGTAFYEWLVMEDEDGYDKAVDSINKGFSFEDGNGTRYWVDSIPFNRVVELVCGEEDEDCSLDLNIKYLSVDHS